MATCPPNQLKHVLQQVVPQLCRSAREDADQFKADADAAKQADVSAAEQTELNQRAVTTAPKFKAARLKSIDAAKEAGLEPPELEPLVMEAMPRRGLARKAIGTPTH